VHPDVGEMGTVEIEFLCVERRIIFIGVKNDMIVCGSYPTLCSTLVIKLAWSMVFVWHGALI
jgi:hypothetical protein